MSFGYLGDRWLHRNYCKSDPCVEISIITLVTFLFDRRMADLQHIPVVHTIPGGIEFI